MANSKNLRSQKKEEIRERVISEYEKTERQGYHIPTSVYDELISKSTSQKRLQEISGLLPYYKELSETNRFLRTRGFTTFDAPIGMTKSNFSRRTRLSNPEYLATLTTDSDVRITKRDDLIAIAEDIIKLNPTVVKGLTAGRTVKDENWNDRKIEVSDVIEQLANSYSRRLYDVTDKKGVTIGELYTKITKGKTVGSQMADIRKRINPRIDELREQELNRENQSFEERKAQLQQDIEKYRREPNREQRLSEAKEDYEQRLEAIQQELDFYDLFDYTPKDTKKRLAAEKKEYNKRVAEIKRETSKDKDEYTAKLKEARQRLAEEKKEHEQRVRDIKARYKNPVQTLENKRDREIAKRKSELKRQFKSEGKSELELNSAIHEAINEIVTKYNTLIEEARKNDDVQKIYEYVEGKAQKFIEEQELYGDVTPFLGITPQIETYIAQLEIGNRSKEAIIEKLKKNTKFTEQDIEYIMPEIDKVISEQGFVIPSDLYSFAYGLLEARADMKGNESQQEVVKIYLDNVEKYLSGVDWSDNIKQLFLDEHINIVQVFLATLEDGFRGHPSWEVVRDIFYRTLTDAIKKAFINGYTNNDVADALAKNTPEGLDILYYPELFASWIHTLFRDLGYTGDVSGIIEKFNMFQEASVDTSDWRNAYTSKLIGYIRKGKGKK